MMPSNSTPNPSRQAITPQNAQQLAPIAKFPVGWITELHFSPDGNILAVANVEDLSLFRFQGNKVVRQRLAGHTEALRTCHFSPDGNWIATGGDDATVRLWNIAPDQPDQCFILQSEGEVQQVRYSPDGQSIAVAVKNIVQIWETSANFNLIHTLASANENLTTLAFSPDGKLIAAAGWDHVIHIWNCHDGSRAATLISHTQRINHVQFMPKTNRLVSAARDGTIRLWDMSSFTEKKVLTAHGASGIDGLAFSQDETLMVTGGRDHMACLWDMQTWQLMATLATHTKPVMSVALHPDHSLLATGSGDNTVIVWAVPL